MKKSSSILILFIIFCVCCGITYFSIKTLPKGEPEQVEKKEKKETKETEEKPKEANKNAINKAITYLKALEIKGKDIIPSELSNEELIFYVYMNSDDFYEEGVTLEHAQSFVKKNLGVELKKGSMPCPTGGSSEPALVIFDEVSNKFVINPDHGAHGAGGTSLDTMNSIENIDVKDDIVTVTVKKLFSAPFGDVSVSTIYYNNFDSAIHFDASEAVYEDIDEPLASEKEYDTGINRDTKNIDYSKASIYEYKFKIDNDNYVLLSYKKIK